MRALFGRGRPSTGTVLGLIALFVALGGTALAATGQLVNIADKTNAANLVKVDGSGRLYVGDGSGPLTVDGRVGDGDLLTAFRKTAIVDSGNCAPVATAPTGKALVVKSLSLDALAVGTSFPYSYIGVGTSCGSGFLQYIDFTERGLTGIDFEPGLVVPAGQSLNLGSSGMTVDALATGYTVPSSQAPPSGTTAAARAEVAPPPHP